MTHYVPDKLCHSLILKILLLSLALVIVIPCNAHNCLSCGKDSLYTEGYYCPECDSRIIELASQLNGRPAEDCNCRGACNCAVATRGCTQPPVPLVGFILAGLTLPYVSSGHSFVAFGALWGTFSLILNAFKKQLYHRDNLYLTNRIQGRNAMLLVNNELAQHPKEAERINVLGADFANLARSTDSEWLSSNNFDELLMDIHIRWLNIWLRSSSNESRRHAALLLAPDTSQNDNESFSFMCSFVLDNPSIVIRPSKSSIFSNSVFPGLEQELNLTQGGYPIHIELGYYLRISLYPVGQGLFDMFETSTGVYRNLTKEDVIKRIGRLCEILGVYIIYIRQSLKTK